MSVITNKLKRNRIHRKKLKEKLKAREQVMYQGKLKKKGWPSN